MNSAPTTAHAPEIDDARALGQGAGIRLREELRVVRVLGDDRLTWLNGQITNDVRALVPGQSVHALAINVRGKIMAELRVVDLGDQLAIILPAATQDSVLESFERYVIMEDVVLERDAEARVLSVQGPRASAVVASEPAAKAHAFDADELGSGGMYVLTTRAQAGALASALAQHGAREISEAGFELARLRSARPRFGIDYNDTNYPQEAGLKTLLSFQKGCYLGQEVVCTLENRGRLHRQLCALHTEQTQNGVAMIAAPLESEPGQVTGAITSAVHDPESGRWLALGYVKRSHVSPGAQLQSGAVTWTVDAAAGEPA